MCCSVFYLRKWYQNIKWFSIDCLRVVLLYFALWLVKNLAPLSRPIRSRSKTNPDLLFTRFPALGAGYMLWFSVLIGSWCCDWSEYFKKLLWFRFYDSQLKTVLFICILVYSPKKLRCKNPYKKSSVRKNRPYTCCVTSSKFTGKPRLCEVLPNILQLDTVFIRVLF